MICIVHHIYSSDQLKKNEMGGAYSAYGGQKRRIQGFGGGKNHLEEPGIDGKIILRWNLRKWDVGYDLDRAGSG